MKTTRFEDKNGQNIEISISEYPFHVKSESQILREINYCESEEYQNLLFRQF